MYNRILTCALSGIEGKAVAVEVDISPGLPGWQMTGLAGTAVKEAWLRVRSALLNSKLPFPTRKVTINLSPADMRKEGTHYDLPMALGILGAMESPTGSWNEGYLEDTAFFGELSLDGSLKGVRGLLPLVLGAGQMGAHRVVIPRANLAETSLMQGMEIVPCDHLLEVVDLVTGRTQSVTIMREKEEHLASKRDCAAWNEVMQETESISAEEDGGASEDAFGVVEDYADVLGHELAKRAMVVAAAGGHGLLMTGSPGSGKTLLARRLVSILPPMTYEEQVEATKIYSVAGLLGPDRPYIDRRPFRSPHHSITAPALLGGGSNPKPGEVSLAHGGVLFLDELGEFDRRTLDQLREPLEDGRVTVARHLGAVTFPSRTLLLAATNPCRCGYYGDPTRTCRCSAADIARYQSKISGPLLDRIDIHIQVSSIMYGNLPRTQTSAQMREQVLAARRVQQARYVDEGFVFNAHIPAAKLTRYCPLDEAGEELMEQAARKLGLSMRACHKVLRIARTLADLKGAEITPDHLAEAMTYRYEEREL